MSAGKILRARQEHPEVGIGTWHRLPNLLAAPLAAFPSIRRDGSFVVVLVAFDESRDPIVVPIAPGASGAPNTVLSVYAKVDGLAWTATQIEYAIEDGYQVFKNIDFAASVPKPGSAEAIPSSPGLIPADGTAKPKRDILSLRKDSTKS